MKRSKFRRNKDIGEDMALRYKPVGKACDRILQECRRLLDQGSPSAEDAYDYDAALTGAPPLPDRIYQRRAERLAEIWQQTRPGTVAEKAT